LYADNISENNGCATGVLHPGSRLLFRQWETLRGALPCPARKSFSLNPVKDIVPNLFILDYLPHLNSFRYRLAGTGLTDFHGRDMTGKDMLGNWDTFEQQMQLRVLRTAQRRRQPALIRSRHFTPRGESFGAEIIALPFSTGSGTETELIGGLFPFAPVRDLAFVRHELVTVRNIWTEHETGDTLLKSIESKGAPLLRVIDGGKA
jgi:hypothetical protein